MPATILTANLPAAQTKGHWRTPGRGVLGRVFTRDSGRTPPSALAFATQHAQATCTHGGRATMEEEGYSTRKDIGEEEGTTNTCRVTPSIYAIFTHGMRASSRYRAPGWTTSPRGRHVTTHHARSLGTDPRAVLRESLLSTRPRNDTRQT